MVLEVFLVGGESCILNSPGVLCWSFSEALECLGEELLLARSLISVHVVLSQNSKVLVPRDYCIIGSQHTDFSPVCASFSRIKQVVLTHCAYNLVYLFCAKQFCCGAGSSCIPAQGQGIKKDVSLPVLGCMNLHCSNLKHWDYRMWL